MSARWSAAFALVLFLGPLLGSSAADVGAPLVRAREGAYEIQILVTPAPLQVGESEWNVWVRDAATGRAVDLAELVLELRRTRSAESESDGAEEPHHHHPDSIAARFGKPDPLGRVLRTTRLEIDAPGSWSGTLRVSEADVVSELRFDFDVEPARSVIVRHSMAFAIVPIGIVVLVIHQWRVLTGLRSPSERRAASGPTW